MRNLKNVNFYVKECPSDRKDLGLLNSRETEEKRETGGKEKERDREGTAARHSINPFAVIATLSLYP